MSTTVIFAEILIVGCQAFIWFSILCFTISDINVDKLIILIGEWKVFSSFIFIMIAYTLGVIVDRIIDSILEIVFDKKIAQKHNMTLSSAKKTKLEIMHKSERINNFLEYQRGRIRIARSTIFNSFFISLSAVLMKIIKPSYLSNNLICTAIILFPLFICGVALYAWKEINERYYERLVQGHEIIST